MTQTDDDKVLSEQRAGSFPWSLSPAEVKSISDSFSEDWGIRYLWPDEFDNKLADVRKEIQFEEAFREFFDRSGTKAINANNEKFFRAICKHQLHGLITSARRARLVDSVSAAVAVVQKENIDGRILDVGCHAGHIASLIADRVPNEMLGIDRLKDAIMAAIEHPSRNSRVEFRQDRIPRNSNEQFGLIVSVDAIHNLPSHKHVKNYGELLEPDGIVLITSPSLKDDNWPKFIKAAAKAGLCFRYAFPVGGYGGASEVSGNQFSSQIMIALQKKDGPKIPASLRTIEEEWWEEFHPPSRLMDTAVTENTYAFYLSKLV